MRFKVSWKHIIFSSTMCMLCPGKSYFVSNRYLKKLMNCKAYASIIRHEETDVQRQTCTDRDRQTAMETDRQMDTQMDRQADRQVDTHTGRQIDRDRQTAMDMDGWTDGRADRRTGRQANTQTHTEMKWWRGSNRETEEEFNYFVPLDDLAFFTVSSVS